MIETSLRYFVVVAKEKSITRAAQCLFISQQGLSAHIKRLEEHYNIKLFERKSPLVLTYAGELLLDAAVEMQRIEKNLINNLFELSNQKRGRLVVGIIPTWANVVIRNVLPIYYRQYPNVDVHILEEDESALIEMTERGQIDMFVGVEPVTAESIQCVPLMQEKLFIIVAEHMMRKYFPDDWREKIERFEQGVLWEEMLHLPVVMQTDTNIVRRLLDRYIREKALTVKRTFESNSNEVLLELCKMGCGIMFSPHILVPYMLSWGSDKERGPLNAFPVLSDIKTYQIVLGHSKDRALSAAGKLFKSTIISVLNDYQKC